MPALSQICRPVARPMPKMYVNAIPIGLFGRLTPAIRATAHSPLLNFCRIERKDGIRRIPWRRDYKYRKQRVN
jgi:hypothetical protein